MSTRDVTQDEEAGPVSDEARDQGVVVTAADEAAAAPEEHAGATPSSTDDDGEGVPAGEEATETAPREAGVAEASGPAPDTNDETGDATATDRPELAGADDADAASGTGRETAADAAPYADDEVPAPVLDRGLVEALLFAADEPLTPAQIKKVLGGVETGEVRAVLERIGADLDDRKAGFALVEVAGGFQFRTRPEYGVWIRQLRSDKPPKLSKPALETLAVVSYRQPVTRAEIEAIRRVDTGAVLKTLLDRRLLKIVGTKDVPGRPALYGTSKEFLEVFRLKSLKELPTLKAIRDVAVEMGDALDVPRELLPEDVAAALPPVEEPGGPGAEPGEDGGEPDASADDAGARESPAVTEEPAGSAHDEPAPSPPSAAAEED